MRAWHDEQYERGNRRISGAVLDFFSFFVMSVCCVQLNTSVLAAIERKAHKMKANVNNS